jgi:pyruvate dehydrogenase E2 component (dihydrolipoamide acetyltransferase)
VPDANAIWAEDRILRLQRCDVGMAVALDGGLVTPVIRGAEALTLTGIAAAAKDLAERGRARKLKPQELQGGATTISNLGMFGIRDFAAIVNPPQSTILALGAAQRRPVEEEDGGLRFANIVTATLSCDHRVVDGALGAKLLAALRALIGNPIRILV